MKLMEIALHCNDALPAILIIGYCQTHNSSCTKCSLLAGMAFYIYITYFKVRSLLSNLLIKYTYTEFLSDE